MPAGDDRTQGREEGATCSACPRRGSALVAHGIHYAIVAVGRRRASSRSSAPRFLGPHRHAPARRARGTRARAPQRWPGPSPTDTRRRTRAGDPTRSDRRSREPVLTTAQRVLLPLAVVSSAAAAGVHAAVGPAHFREGTLFGVVLRGCRARPAGLGRRGRRRAARGRCWSLGAVGNLAVLALWGVTRTLGLPFGLLPEPGGGRSLGPRLRRLGAGRRRAAASLLLRSRHRSPAASSAGAAGTRRCTAFVAGSVLAPGRALPQRSRRMNPTTGKGVSMESWQVGLVGNTVIMVAYLGISPGDRGPAGAEPPAAQQPARSGDRGHLLHLRGAPRRALGAHAAAVARLRRPAGAGDARRRGAGRWPPGTSSAPSSPSTTGRCAATTAR